MLDRKVPRYLSYPTAAQFHEGIGAAQFDLWTEGLTPGSRVTRIFCRRGSDGGS